MANNTIRGIRWVRSLTGAGRPVNRYAVVADNYGTKLVVGDAITRVSTGYVQRAVGSEGTQTDILGVVTNVVQYYDSTDGVLKNGWVLPASTRWGSSGTNFEQRSIVEYIPAEGNVFEIDCDTDEGTSFDTPAEIYGYIGENADLIVESVTGNVSPFALDISTHNTTNTLQCRIEGFPDLFAANNVQDFSTTLRLKALITFNRAQSPLVNTTGI